MGERSSPCKSPAMGLGLLCPGDIGEAQALDRNEQGAESGGRKVRDVEGVGV